MKRVCVFDRTGVGAFRGELPRSSMRVLFKIAGLGAIYMKASELTAKISDQVIHSFPSIYNYIVPHV
jgi:hypothetical protein